MHELLHAEVLRPLGINARIGEELQPDDPRVPGYVGDKAKERWISPIPSDGGVDVTIADLRRWIEANLDPAATPIEETLRLAQSQHWPGPPRPVGLGWQFGANVKNIWHNGAQAGCYSLVVAAPDQRFGFGFVMNRMRDNDTEKRASELVSELVAG